MPISYRYMLIAVILLLNGCGGGLFYMTENPEVAKKCSPIQSIVAKNYDVDARAVVAGFTFRRSGTELPPEVITRLVDLDAVCRSWVAGAVNSKEWAEYLRKNTAASYVKTAGAGTSEALSKALEPLRAAIEGMQLPPQYATTQDFLDSVRTLAEEYAKSKPEDVTKALDQAYTALGDKIRAGNAATDTYLAAQMGSLNKRIDDLTKQIEVISPPQPPPKQETLTEQFASVNARLQDLTTSVELLAKKLPGGVLPPFTGPKTDSKHLWDSKNTHTVYFEINSALVSKPEQRNLEKKFQEFAGKLLNFDISGFADTSGSRKTNQTVSLNRALAVKGWMIDSLKIPSAMISVSGRVAGTDQFDAKDRSKNRVAVIRWTDPQ